VSVGDLNVFLGRFTNKLSFIRNETFMKPEMNRALLLRQSEGGMFSFSDGAKRL
jgi:hypothetical protein